MLGQLIALYEHITFTQGVVWGIDSFDQWGVELGKQLAQEVTPPSPATRTPGGQDASTQSLIAYYRRRAGDGPREPAARPAGPPAAPDRRARAAWCSSA